MPSKFEIQLYAIVIGLFIYHLKIMISLKNEGNKKSLFLYSNLKTYTLIFLIWCFIFTFQLINEIFFKLNLHKYVDELYLYSIIMYISSYLIIKGVFLIQIFLKKRNQLDEIQYKSYITNLNKTFNLKFNGYIGGMMILFFLSKILNSVDSEWSMLPLIIGAYGIIGIIIKEFLSFHKNNKNNLP